MNDHVPQIDTLVVDDHEALGAATAHIGALVLYRDSVVRPSLGALSDKIDELQRDEDARAEFELLDYEPMYQSTVEGYLLAVQSMWERGLRGLLINRAKRLSKGVDYAMLLQRATWMDAKKPDLHDYFHELIGLPLKSFYSHADLDLLQLLGSALRHGNGQASRKLHEKCPSLWTHWLAPGTRMEVGTVRIEIPANAPKHPDFELITLPLAVLEQMIQSVIWFWEDIEYIRCNSFKRKHATVVASLRQQVLDRPYRSAKRVWSP